MGTYLDIRAARRTPKRLLALEIGVAVAMAIVMLVQQRWILVAVAVLVAAFFFLYDRVGPMPRLLSEGSILRYSTGHARLEVDLREADSVGLVGGLLSPRAIRISGPVVVRLSGGRVVQRRVLELPDIFPTEIGQLFRQLEVLKAESRP